MNREEVEHIALLARLGLREEEVERMQGQLSHILENFEVLREVDTTGVALTSHSIPLENVLRRDEVAPSFPRGEVLANAPWEEEGCFRVKAVLE